MTRMITLCLFAALLSACASHKDNCEDMSCRPQSDNHHLVIWWPSSMREGDQNYSTMPVR
ncbi:type III secretion protein HrpT [Pantoea sp. ICBG 1758]|uniref:HrpT family type III secretion system protein n=1 Tax=Pantoea sp. ICBG 1758 TaxID=2071682 RepID=UPI000CE34EF1|nr:type III secretion protein HrpT [Pantoea sp. ICBG 1758]